MSRISKEEAMYGKEPTWGSKSDLSVSNALYWYQNLSTPAQKKSWAIDQLTKDGYFTAAELLPIPEFYLSTIGAMCRMISRGYQITEPELNKVLSLVSSRVKLYNITDESKGKSTGKRTVKNDQVNDKLGRVIYPFDALIDLVLHGTKTWELPDVTEKITKAQSLSIAKEFETELKDLESAYDKTDADLVEAYSTMPRMVIRRLIQLHKEIVSKFEFNAAKKVAAKKPRKKKITPVTKLVAKLNFLEHDNKLGLNSIKPELIVGSEKLVVYNTKTRALIVFYSKTCEGFGVKGSTLQNVDFDRSASKTLRKPDQQLQNFVKAAKMKTDKTFNDVRSVAKPVTGRINKYCILLKKF